MAGTTLAQAQESLDAARAALAASGAQQEYQTIGPSGGRRVVRASVADLLATLKYWEGEVARLSRGGMCVQSVVPL